MTTAAATPQLTIEDARTGIKVSPYIGADPIDTPEPITQTVDRGDSLVAIAAVTADPTTPDPSIPVEGTATATEPPATGDGEGVAADPAASSAEPSDSVTPPDALRNNKGQFIPRKRFNEVNDEKKILAAENAALKAQLAGKAPAEPVVTPPAPVAYDFAAKERQYIDLILDGKTDDALALRTEISGEQQKQFIALAQQSVVDTTRQLTVTQRIEEIGTRYESDYDVLNPESDSYDEEVLNDVQSLMTGFSQTNRYADAAERLEAAIKGALTMNGIALKAAAPVASAPAVPAIVPATRTATKRVQAIVGQPPLIAKTGVQSGEHGDISTNVRELSDKQFRDLPEATKRRLRGDEV